MGSPAAFMGLLDDSWGLSECCRGLNLIHFVWLEGDADIHHYFVAIWELSWRHLRISWAVGVPSWLLGLPRTFLVAPPGQLLGAPESSLLGIPGMLLEPIWVALSNHPEPKVAPETYQRKNRSFFYRHGTDPQRAVTWALLRLSWGLDSCTSFWDAP